MALVDRLAVDMHAAAVARLTRLAEGLQQTLTDPLAGHLDQAQRGDLGDLVLGAVAAEALDEPAHDEVTVALEHHVNEVDDDDPAQVAQPQLARDLLGGLEVVAGDRLLEVAPLADVFTGVDVDDDHRLGAVDDQRATGRQPDLAVQRLEQLLIDAVLGEDVFLGGVPGQPRRKVRGDEPDVVLDGLPLAVTLDDQGGEVLVEHVAHNPDDQVGLGVQQRRSATLGRLGLDDLPLRLQPAYVVGDLLFGSPLGRRPDDDARVVRDDLLQDRLEAVALGLGQLAADAGHRTFGHVDQVAARQADLAGEA